MRHTLFTVKHRGNGKVIPEGSFLFPFRLFFQNIIQPFIADIIGLDIPTVLMAAMFIIIPYEVSTITIQGTIDYDSGKNPA